MLGKDLQKTILSSSLLEMEQRSPVWNLDTISYMKAFSSFSNTSTLFLTLPLNKDKVWKDFSVFVKKLFQRSGHVVVILNLF